MINYLTGIARLFRREKIPAHLTLPLGPSVADAERMARTRVKEDRDDLEEFFHRSGFEWCLIAENADGLEDISELFDGISGRARRIFHKVPYHVVYLLDATDAEILLLKMRLDDAWTIWERAW